MIYIGSKRKLAKYLLPIILKNRKEGQFYVEPFVGGANIIENVDGNRIGNDLNKFTIQGLISIRDFVDELPKNNKEFTEEDYNKLKTSDDYKHKGFAGYSYSFAGKFLDSFSKSKKYKNRDFVKTAYNHAKKQSPKLKGLILKNVDYKELKIPKNSIIYCDPPYFLKENYYKYKFNYDEFWKWVREKSKEGHEVYVSEYTAPTDFECVFEIKQKKYFSNKNKNKITTEKLFKLKK